jgi:hypothetical protein
MTHDDTLKRAVELLRHMSDAGSTDEYRSCNDCATAIDALREELARQVPFDVDGLGLHRLRLEQDRPSKRKRVDCAPRTVETWDDAVHISGRVAGNARRDGGR